MAKISLRPVEPLELEFADGTSMTALFNNEAFVIYSQEFGELDMEEAETKPYDLMGKILYCGLKVVNPKISLEEAQSILYMGGGDLLLEITESLINNFNMTSNEETKKKYQALLTTEQTEILKAMNLL